MPVFQLNRTPHFPPVHLADPSGLLAVGGELTPDFLIAAYQQGIFPWFNPGDPIMWWSPDPRMVLFPDELKVSKSMRNVLNQRGFRVEFDVYFEEVIAACSAVPREGQDGTWITAEMVMAYIELHHLGVAHCVAVFNRNKELVGGLYGVAIGRCFFGESMFAKESNASKVGFVALVQWLRDQKYQIIDCQMSTSHLASLGAREINRTEFIERINKATAEEVENTKWSYSGFPSYQRR